MDEAESDVLAFMSFPKATASAVMGSHGNNQVGWAVFGGVQHAGMWAGGTADSWIDLSTSLPALYAGESSAAGPPVFAVMRAQSTS